MAKQKKDFISEQDKNAIVNLIKNKGLKIKNKEFFIQEVIKYNIVRLIDGYAKCLELEEPNDKKKYIKGTTTNQVLNLFTFDQELACILLRYFKQFEQQLNSITLYTVMKKYNLGNDYILNVNNVVWMENKKSIEFNQFRDSIFDYVATSNFLKSYNDYATIPLQELCLSWSFHTTILFFDLQSETIKKEIMEQFHTSNASSKEFTSACHTLRKFRNSMSHNDILFRTKISTYTKEFNSLLSTTSIKKQTNVNNAETTEVIPTLPLPPTKEASHEASFSESTTTLSNKRFLVTKRFDVNELSHFEEGTDQDVDLSAMVQLLERLLGTNKINKEITKLLKWGEFPYRVHKRIAQMMGWTKK